MWGRAVLGIVLFLVGGLWFLQGIGIAKGSVMTGHAVWAVIGVPLAAVGIALTAAAARSRGRQPADED